MVVQAAGGPPAGFDLHIAHGAAGREAVVGGEELPRSARLSFLLPLGN